MGKRRMKKEDRLKIQAFLDGELASRESVKISDLIDSDLEARTVADELKSVKKLLKHGENELKLEDSRDFYWSQVHRQIEAGNSQLLRQSRPSSASRMESPFRWILPIGCMAAIVVLMINFNTINPKPSNAVVPEDSTGNAASGLTESLGSAMEEEVASRPEVGVFSFEGIWKNDRNLLESEDPSVLPESIENPER